MKKLLSILLAFIIVMNVAYLQVDAAEEDNMFYGDEWGRFNDEADERIGHVLYSVENGTCVVEVDEEVGITYTFIPTNPSHVVIENLERSFFTPLDTEHKMKLDKANKGNQLVYTLSPEDVPMTDFLISGLMSMGSTTKEWYDNTVLFFEGYTMESSDFSVSQFILDIKFGPDPTPARIDLFAVRVESNYPEAATFSGYGTGFVDGEAYDVRIDSIHPDYEFLGWSTPTSGVIDGADVTVVATFEYNEPVIFEDDPIAEGLESTPRYNVSAVSEPEGVATYVGEGDFRNGDSFRVEVATVAEGYVFDRWETVNSGVVDGVDVVVVAVFKNMKEEPPVEEPIDEPILDEEVPQNVDALPDTAGIPLVAFLLLGGALGFSGFGLKRKK